MVELQPEGPCELGGCVVKNAFEGTGVEDNEIWKGM